ncbi:MAG: hypothetical protein V3W05_00115, partial [candidate division NC10 bacterium]
MTRRTEGKPIKARLPLWRRLGWRLGASFLLVSAVGIFLAGHLQYRSEEQVLRRAIGVVLLNVARTSAILIDGELHESVVKDGSTDTVAYEKLRKILWQIQHFGPEGNLFEDLGTLFRGYSENATGRRRTYIHNEEVAAQHGFPPGSLTPWEPIPDETDLLFYEGLHGGLITDQINIAQYVDLLIGVVPIINLEWMQKIHRDQAVRGYTAEDATNMILSRMH